MADEDVPPTIDLGEPIVVTLSGAPEVPPTPPPSTDNPPIIPLDPIYVMEELPPEIEAEVAGSSVTSDYLATHDVTVTQFSTSTPSTELPPGSADPLVQAATGQLPAEDAQAVVNRTLDQTITPDLLAASTYQLSTEQTQQATNLAVDRMILTGFSGVGSSPTQDTLASTSSTAETVSSTANIADGSTPTEESAQAQTASTNAIARQAGYTDDSFDPNLLSSATSGFGPLPHKFLEKNYQVYHNEVVVYIQGVDVSEWLEGTVTVSQNMNAEPNSCEITLNNAMNRWILTPENLNGSWRLGNSSHEVAEYDESAKKAIYDIKNPLGNNPVDPLSGGRMWPIDHWSPIFHKMDPIRVWIHNPVDPESDEYLPLFTGYVVNVSMREDYKRHGSTITLSCKDIRYLMSKMRTNTNSILWVQPGNEFSTNATSYSQSTTGSDVGGGAFSADFFQDLVVRNQVFENPWANMNLFQVISSLTYDDYNPVQTIDNNIQNDIRTVQREIESLRAQLSSIPETPYADTSEARQRLQQQIAQRESRLSRLNNSGAAPTNAASSGNTGTAPASGGAQAPNGQTQQQQANNHPNSGLAPTTPRGRGRIGRMRKGKLYAYPKTEDLDRITDEPDDGTENMTDQQLMDAGSRAMTLWTDIVVFGYPNREVDERGLDGRIIDDTTTCKYWTHQQVQSAGELTRSNRAWAPDVQLVHVLKPRKVSSGDAVIQDNTYLTNSGVNVQYNWTTRLDLLSEACDAVDYRFYVTGSGDLVFEFPQYDFYPNDYNLPTTTENYGWQPIYEFDRDLLDSSYDPESGEIVTAVIVVGGLTGYSQFADVNGEAVREYAPEIRPNAVCYSPLLTGRHGVNIKEKTLPLITDRSHLAQIAAMEFQKSLGLASTYTMDVAYRPWVTINRPVFNKFHNRYAVVDSVTHTISVRESAGDPQTTLSLSYPRNIDQFGVPRFLTGGPSLPVFYGRVPDRSRSLRTVQDNVQSRSEAQIRMLQALEANTLTEDDIARYQSDYNAPFPESYDFYNIVLIARSHYSASGESATGGAIINLLGRAQQIQQQISDVYANSRLSVNDRSRRIQTLSRELEQVTTELSQARAEVAATDPTSPLFGTSGIRTPENREQPEVATIPAEEVYCDLDPYNWSSPLGRNAQAPQEWPRRIIRSFSEATHPGVDYAAHVGEKVYAIGDGHVVQITDHRTFGPMVKIQHQDFFSVVAPVSPSVSVGDGVRRNQEIGTVSSSPESSDVGFPILHISLGSANPPNQVRRPFFDPPVRYPLEPKVLRSAVALRQSFAQNRSHQSGASATRVHGGYDLGCDEGHDVVATVGGHIQRVFTNTVHGSPPANREGHGIIVVDRYGAKHGYFHFRDPVDQTRYFEGAAVSAGDILGKAGHTGSATGTHLHYQIEVPGGRNDRLRVDIGPRLAALFKGLPVVDQIAKCEASLWGKESGVRMPPRTLPDTAPETPVPGLTVEQIWREVGAGSGGAATAASVPIVAGAQFFDTAVPSTEPTAIPFLVPPGSITNSDQLTFAILGDKFAEHRSQFRIQFESNLKTLLGRSVNLTSYSVARATIVQWLESPEVAAARTPRSLRSAHTGTLQDVASDANFIIVTLNGTETGAADMTPARIQQVDAILRSQGAFVVWVIHKPQPATSRSLYVIPGQRPQTIQQLLDNGVTLTQADVRVATGNQIRAAGVRYVDSGTDRIDRIGRDPGFVNGDYTRAGARATTPGLAQSAVTQLREIARNADITTTDTNDWANAVPPEDCPPGNQRRLYGDGVTPPDIPGAPTVTPGPESTGATTVAEQASQASTRTRRRSPTRRNTP